LGEKLKLGAEKRMMKKDLTKKKLGSW